MSLYFESPVQFNESGIITTNGVWHQTSPLLATGSYSQERGGFVTIFDDLGEPLRDINFPSHPVCQVTALVWHPERNILASGWENGEIKIWNGMDKDFTSVVGPHKAPVVLLEFSEKGGRLVSSDSNGSLVGWKVDVRGQTITAFHHDLKESITHLTFRTTVKSHPDFDIESLAKAAVNGDEHALDMFSNWRPKTTARKFRVQDGADNQCFFVGTQAGSIYYVNNSGSCTEVLNTEGVPLNYILYHPVKDALIVVMEGLTIGHFSVDSQGLLTELTRVKLSGRTQSNRGIGCQGIVWAGTSCLAILTGDLTVRMWDIESNDNFILPTNLKHHISEEKSHQINEMFTCIAFSKVNQTLCGGTNVGRIYFWNKKKDQKEISDNPEDNWELTNVSSVAGTIKQVMWGSVNLRLPLLSINCVTKVYILKEQNLCTCFSEKIWATQNSASQVLLEIPDSSYMMNLEMQITDMSINENYVAFTNGRAISIYEIIWKKSSDNKYDMNAKLGKTSNEKSKIMCNLVNTITCDNESIIMHGKNVITLFVNGISIRSPNGLVLASIPVISAEGEPIGMDLCNSFLTVFTMDGFLKIYDVSEDEPRLITGVRSLYDMCTDFGEIMQAKTNSSGTKVALTLAASNLIPDGKLYVWDIEQDNLSIYDFRKYGDQKSSFDDERLAFDESNCLSPSEYETDSKALNDKICSNRIPLNIFWDFEDPRLLVCNAKKIKINKEKKGFGNRFAKKNKDKPKSLEEEDHVIVTMFVSTEFGIRIQDIKAIEPETRLLATATPYIVLLRKLNIHREIMNDFKGLENCNKNTRDAVLDFSYNLSLGNMDAAFKAIKLVQSPGVWASLARMCVKTRKLDVAGVCLGHMGNARAARALRHAMEDSSLPHEAKLAVLAIQLDMLEEAEQLYIQCERYDLLNKLKQCRNKMDEALNIAQTKDRIHLRNTEHAYARSLEQCGKFAEAIGHYEKANTYRYDVPRMLIDQQEQLEAYMSKTNDPELLKWWGQYIESQGDMEAALKIYVSAGDIYSQVRVLCFLDDEGRASDLARAGNDKAAYYYMARHYETKGNIDEAVKFFTRANAYNNAVRLAKENNMAEDLWNIALVSGNREKLECARYFEEIGSLENAVILYHRAGMLHKALDLAFKHQQFDVLQQIATDLNSESDPALVQKCADYFVSNEQYDKAVDLLAIAKKYKEAIGICLNYNVQLTDELAEKLTPEKDQVDDETRLSILENLADSLLVQGNYHLATKKFTQAGNKIRGMKALLKSGDTEKIIFFAGVSRQKEIYIMAANYLQSLDWQNQPEVLKNIITFYSKGKALDLLANFYVACAQVEIDEFQNYEKAFGALMEASKCLAKVANPKDPVQHRNATEIVQQRLTIIKRFVDIRRLFERNDIQGGITQCRQLLATGGPDLEMAVRKGDIYALMIQHCVKNNSFEEAKILFAELKQVLATTNNMPITYYVSKEVIEGLAHGLGISPVSLLPPSARQRNEDATQDDVEEEITEE